MHNAQAHDGLLRLLLGYCRLALGLRPRALGRQFGQRLQVRLQVFLLGPLVVTDLGRTSGTPSPSPIT